MIKNAAELAYAQFEELEELALQRAIVMHRDQYENTIVPTLAAELENSLLAGSAEEVPGLFNFYAAVIDEVLNRLVVTAITVDQDEDAAEADWAMDWWQEFDMDQLIDELIEATLVDGEAFIMLQPEYTETGQIKIVPYVHRRFTSAEAGGNNEGCRVHYKEKKPVMFSKRWVELDQTSSGFRSIFGKSWQGATQYMTLFLPTKIDQETGQREAGLIKRYKSNGRGWDELEEEPWQLTAMPIIHFTAPGRRSRGHNAAGPQMLLDNFVTSLAVGTSIATLPTLVVIGGYPTIDGEAPQTDGSNVWKLGAGSVIGFPRKGPEQAKVDYMRPGDLSQHIEAIAQSVTYLAVTTGTPSLMSQNIRADAAAELIRRIEQKPIAYARKAQVTIGNGITRMFEAIVELNNALGTGDKYPEGPVFAKWQTADTAVTAVSSTEETPEIMQDDEQLAVAPDKKPVDINEETN